MRTVTATSIRPRRASQNRVLGRTNQFLALAVAFLVYAWPAAAIELPPVVEEYRLLARSWTLEGPSGQDDRFVLAVMHKGRSYRWPVEPGWIAQSLQGNNVKDKDVTELLMNHIKQTNASSGDLMFKLASLRDRGELFVRSFKLFDAADSYQRASQLGSPILNMDANEVHQLGIARYTKEVNRTTDIDWLKIERR
jgi:hypothetical protein